MRASKNRLLAIAMLIVAVATQTAANAQEKMNPHFFGEMTGGIGTSYTRDFINATGVYHVDKTTTYGQWSPSVGLEINDRWSVGARMTFQTGDKYSQAEGTTFITQKYTVTTLYGQYSFLNLNRWSVFVEGKGSYYHGIEYHTNTSEIGLSLGAKFNITGHLSAILHYVYTGVEIGDLTLSHPDGCIGGGRYTLDFSPRRLQIGLRYKF